MSNSEKALQMHEQWNGKLETTAKAHVNSRDHSFLPALIQTQPTPTQIDQLLRNIIEKITSIIHINIKAVQARRHNQHRPVSLHQRFDLRRTHPLGVISGQIM